MSDSLTGEQRTALERLVQQGRRWIEDDLATTLGGRYGIDDDGRIDSVANLALTNAGTATRQDLVDILDHLRGEGESADGAVARLVREATFTHLNRLLAVRVAEAIGLLPETIGKGVASTGFRDFCEMAPTVAGTEWGRFGVFVRLCGDELASDVAALFDPRNPLLELEPTEAALERVVGALTAVDVAIWAAPDALGWVYQFFNTQDERKAIKDNGAPRSPRELAITNQFFTPSYVVDFLVHNGLGAHLAAGYPALVDELPSLADPPTEHRAIDLATISVLDPACGSGHFLLGAYDVLEKAWRHAGVEPADSAPSIVASLWGVDIDPRVTQIAQAAIVFRARRHCRTAPLPRPNITCARSLPLGPVADELIEALPGLVGRAVRAIADDLIDAPSLGPLLRVEERLDREARDVFGTGMIRGTLAEAVNGQATEALVFDALERLADSATSSAAQRVFAAEAHDAIRFVQAMSRRYTAVLMNPPFGDPIGSTKAYLKAAYGDWIPATSDLFGLFVGRGLELAERGGSVGAITSRVGLFLTSFDRWRSEVLLRHDLGPLVDLGEKVMEQATVDAAAYVIRAQGRRKGLRPTMIRALTMVDRAAELPAILEAVRSGDGTHPAVFRPDLEALVHLDERPIVYWIDSDDVRVLSGHPPFEPGQGVVRQGLATGDDFRFVRAWWEVTTQRSTRPPELSGGTSASEQLFAGARWAPIVKAGTSQPWFSPNLLVVDWERDGERLRGFVDSAGKLRSRPQNTEHYFKPGFSWTRRAPRLVPYVVPEGCISSVSRYQAFPAGDPYEAIAVVASNVASAFLRFYGEKFLWPNFLVENVKSLPIPPLPADLRNRVAGHVEEQVAVRRTSFRELEPFREFVAPRDHEPDLSWDRHSLLGEELELAIAGAYGFSEVAYTRLVRDLREALVMLGNSTGDDDPEDEVDMTASWLVRLTSYLIGVAFGRWDVRTGADPRHATGQPGAFDPPSPITPGMLVDERGAPAASAPDSYPVAFPLHGCLVDQRGHAWDLEARVRVAAGVFLGSDAELDEVVSAEMARPSLAKYLRTSFFKAHLRTYSQGRRRAPIYWQLQVPSKNWGVWLYYPKLSREMIFALVAEAEQRLRLADQQVAALQREANSGGVGRKASDVAAALDAERKLSVELASFQAEAERIANLGWEPDLDDGAVLNAAPFANLFPAWKDATAYRRELRAGKHEWATVARFADEL